MAPGRIKTAPPNRRMSATGAVGAAAVIAVAALAASIGLLLSSGGGTADAKGQPSSAPPARPAIAPARPAIAPARPAIAPARAAARLRPAAQPPAVPASTELATVRATAPGYAVPGRLAAGPVAASWYGRPSVLPVIATRPGWVRVRLAQRPDGSTAWLPASDVTLSSTPYRIVVNLGTTRLALYDRGRLVFSAPAGVGAEGDPTPTGEFFVAFDEAPPEPNPGYGPFIIVTSDHSQAISDWEGSGDAVIGIHGPLGEDGLIGTTGARISHGCVRLHLQSLERLTRVPPGTPIDVIG
ncbi:MAG TPA: L,D-transpeptidase [Trebonia sp.]|nr:L,D-transpeptidase [Trebonia sp.]